MQIRGFTLIELMIVLCIIGILSALVIPIVTRPSPKHTPGPSIQMNQPATDSMNSNETCIRGYVFVVGKTGSPTQILDNQGHGIPCN